MTVIEQLLKLLQQLISLDVFAADVRSCVGRGWFDKYSIVKRIVAEV